MGKSNCLDFKCLDTLASKILIKNLEKELEKFSKREFTKETYYH